MQISKFILLIAPVAISTVAAAENKNVPLGEERIQVVKRYVTDLQQADYKDIVELFANNADVISTSRGRVNAKEFFYSFLPNIASANTKLGLTFTSDIEPNHVLARFHFQFKLKDGEAGEGEYVDEFVFAEHSAKLNAVYMFENLKFNPTPT